jgi:hypothetical protein
MTDEKMRMQAVKRLVAKRYLKIHVAIYALVNVALLAIWSLAGGGYFWPAWAILGWGIGLAAHTWSVYGVRAISESDIQREMDRIR